MKPNRVESKIFSIKLIIIVIGIFFVATTGSKCHAQRTETDSKPNIVLINVDDLGYGDLSCYGAKKVHTPNIDQLAKDGRMFMDAHSASAVCTPSRYSLITGEYPFRKEGLSSPIFLKDPLVINPNQKTIASILKQSGYSTAVIGKWHLGFGTKKPVDWNAELKPGPLELGFDYYFGLPVVNSHPPFVYVENHHVVGANPKDPFVYDKKAETKYYIDKMHYSDIGGAKAAHQLYNDEKVGTTLKNKAIEWIVGQDKKKPFFLYFATTNIHHPFTPAPQFKNTSEAGRYGDFIHELDWIVGEILNTLDEQGLAENTMVIFTSDNGGMLNEGGQAAWRKGHRLNGDLLGFKFDAWEGGHRIPFIVKWPGKVPKSSVSDELICNVDMLATFAALTKTKLNRQEGKDSYNILPAFISEGKLDLRKDIILSPFKLSHTALRMGKWLYINEKGHGGFSGKNIGDHGLGGAAAHLLTKQINSEIESGELKVNAAPAQLYNLDADIGQKVNLYYEEAEIATKMKEALQDALNSERTAPLLKF